VCESVRAAHLGRSESPISDSTPDRKAPRRLNATVPPDPPHNGQPNHRRLSFDAPSLRSHTQLRLQERPSNDPKSFRHPQANPTPKPSTSTRPLPRQSPRTSSTHRSPHARTRFRHPQDPADDDRVHLPVVAELDLIGVSRPRSTNSPLPSCVGIECRGRDRLR
jgi:hypothetical protein